MNPLIASGLPSHGTSTALSVNLNKVALLRNTRTLTIPSVTHAARLAIEAGAQGITVHPRPDQRHIRTHDVHDLAAMLKAHPHIEYNIEGNPFHNLMDLVRELRPHQATFVPDSVEQSTSDHGWSLPEDNEALRPLIDECHALGVRVSLFMDPLPEAMAQARLIGADRVELYTEAYARSHAEGAGTPQHAALLACYTAAAEAALAVGLGLNAGHDLNRDNLTAFLRAVPGVQEVSIGHALIADALELGLTETVRDYLRCIHRAHA
ncbi:pyridoxine 5'-phosphate synthase [Methylibium sp. Root1272]|uniref:pyridoxine 5'-phosphate synthase n=1 Tax=Methylibium sp. Root1272 TaxID=1736441 RepID=UPI0006FC131C|nr:pyridoxine 5'-phosphate synthase [Methylibium sp. Root1272]KQW65796.1 pyridoxine 5'-phosphate synthase [Methylibium sp. Root1272]